jgi:hypothetical protein
MVGFGVASAFSSSSNLVTGLVMPRRQRFSALWLIKGKRVIKEMTR